MAKRRQVRNKTASYSSAWLWFFCGLVSGLLLATIALQSGWIQTPASLHVTPDNVVDDDPEGIAPDPEDNDRQYDFFHVLPEQDHVVTNREIEQANRNTPDTNTNDSSTYQLQVGSFRSEPDADALKANLVLLGVSVRVIPVNVDGVTWHRVRVGPLQTLREANRVRQRLEDDGY